MKSRWSVDILEGGVNPKAHLLNESTDVDEEHDDFLQSRDVSQKQLTLELCLLLNEFLLLRFKHPNCGFYCIPLRRQL